jgi:beta-lactam-binding protein with PASTA domain
VLILNPLGLDLRERLFPTKAAVSGRVVLSGGGSAGGALLTLDGSAEENAGADGDFLITDVGTGTHRLDVTYPGASPAFTKFTIDKGETKLQLDPIEMKQMYPLGYVIERVGDPQLSGQELTQKYDLYLWIAGTTADLKRVKSVAYTLPRPLPPTVIRRTDRSTQFCYHERGVQPLSVVNELGIALAQANVTRLDDEHVSRSSLPAAPGVQPPSCPVTKKRNPTGGSGGNGGGGASGGGGSHQVRVPAVVGMTQQNAVTSLTRSGLRAQPDEVSSDKEPGTVTAQSPAADTLVARGSQVQIKISTGPSPQPESVPDVIGQTYDSAVEILQARGFKPTPVEVKSDQAAGTVVDQDPKGGTTVANGTTITLSVSQGPPAVAVPDVTGQDVADASATLENAGFHTSIDLEDTTDPALDGIVHSQNPTAGTEAKAESLVTLLVGRYVPASTTTAP